MFVATEHDTVYALDAANGTIRWQRHLGEPVPNSSLPCGNVDPVGVTSTPVVDVAAARLYVVGLVAPLEHVLFELDAHNGNQVASIRVDAPGADPGAQNQRAALTLTNNTVFIPFGGRYGDCGDYRGRVVAVSVRNGSLRATTSYTLPTTRRGGFWAPPGLVVASDGSLFVASGNSAGTTTYDDGNSVLRFDASLHLRDVWAPRDWADLNSNDTDIGATNPVLVAGDRVFQIGKSGTGYLLDAVHLGGVGGELYASDVCGGGGAYGAVAHDQATLYVPCSSGLARVSVHDNSFSTDWRAKASTPGPPVVASSTVWFVATDNGTLEALDAGTGRKLSSRHIGTAPSRFTAPAVGDNEVVVAADRRVIAFAD